MTSLFQHFWLICGAWVGLGNAGFFRYRLSDAIGKGAISKIEADRFAAGTIGWIGGPCIFLWVLQFLFAKERSPFFLTWDSPYSSIASAMCGALWAISFIWIWFLGGDKKLARIFTLARYQTYLWQHPIAFRIAILLMVASGVAGLMMRDRVNWPAP